MKKRSKSSPIIIATVLSLMFLVSFFAIRLFTKPYVNVQETKYINIPTGSKISDVKEILDKAEIIENFKSFEIFSTIYNYKENIKPGRYKISDKMTANELVKMLRIGRQSPVKLTFNNIRFLSKFAGIVGNKLELDSAKLMNLLTDRVFLSKYGFNEKTSISMFLPNTYFMFWNTTEIQFIDKMKGEYDKFWTEERKQKAAKIGLTINEISTLASIVQEETNKKNEMSLMAGVLINRLKNNMKLQADPTARFAYGDFDVNRITSNYTSIKSEYNTYYVFGLPPGPINMVESDNIDAVLNYKSSDYLYYCAKADGSGYHAYAITYAEHQRNAIAYHKYLDKHGYLM